MAQFKPGQSGNPGGRAKGILRELREKHREDVFKIVDALVGIALNADEKAKDRIAASKEALDRIIGRPQQKVDLSGDLSIGKRVDMSDLTEEQLQALAALDPGLGDDGPVH